MCDGWGLLTSRLDAEGIVSVGCGIVQALAPLSTLFRTKDTRIIALRLSRSLCHVDARRR